MSCRSCKHWGRAEDDQAPCRRFPPVPVRHEYERDGYPETEVLSIRPTTYGGDSCGEYVQRVG